VGDSHSVGVFGRTLDQALRSRFPRAHVWFYGESSATPDYYAYGLSSHGGFFQHLDGAAPRYSSPAQPEAACPKLGGLLAKTHATVAIVALGTNLLRTPLDGARAQIDRALQAIRAQGSRCIWVGGPDERFVPREKQAELYRILAEATQEAGCALIDSRRFTHYPDRGGDGIHYDGIVLPAANGQPVHVGIDKAREWARQVGDEIARVIGAGS
jgi:hypothetical protein